MASEIEIVNMAISRIGANRIQSLNDQTKEAREAKLHYPFARDRALEAHDWNFARKRFQLALLDESYSGWNYAYQMPIDCACPRKIIDPTTAVRSDNPNMPTIPPIKFESGVSSDLSHKVILTDQENAELLGTAKVTDPNLFSSAYVNALAWLLASDLAIPVKGKEALADRCYKMFMQAVATAEAQNANANEEKRDQSCSFLEARA